MSEVSLRPRLGGRHCMVELLLVVGATGRAPSSGTQGLKVCCHLTFFKKSYTSLRCSNTQGRGDGFDGSSSQGTNDY